MILLFSSRECLKMSDAGSESDDHPYDDIQLHSLLPAMTGASDQTHDITAPSLPVRNKLYVSHFLSTWNSRVFEFGAILFLSTIFPGTLLPASVYALARAASVILFSGFVGRFIDHGERMHVVRTSIGEYRYPFLRRIIYNTYSHCLVQLGKEWQQPSLASCCSS